MYCLLSVRTSVDVGTLISTEVQYWKAQTPDVFLACLVRCRILLALAFVFQCFRLLFYCCCCACFLDRKRFAGDDGDTTEFILEEGAAGSTDVPALIVFDGVVNAKVSAVFSTSPLMSSNKCTGPDHTMQRTFRAEIALPSGAIPPTV